MSGNRGSATKRAHCCGERAPCSRCVEPAPSPSEPRWRLTMFACGIVLLFVFDQLVLAGPQ